MIVFETDFSSDPQGVKLTGDVLNPFAGSKQALIDSGITNKFLLQADGAQDAHGMVVDDPTNPGNPVFMLSGGKRVQTKLGGLFIPQGLSEQRMYFHPDHMIALDRPSGQRLYMWQELKIRPGGTGEDVRISFRILADINTKKFGWFVHLHVDGNDIWRDFVWNPAPPIGEGWPVMRTWYSKGDAETGRIKVTMQREGQAEQVVHDITDWTDDPNHPDSPRDTQEWFPQKQLFGGAGDAAQFVVDNGGVIRQYIDWWRFSIPGTEPGTNGGPPGGTTMQLGTYWDDTAKKSVLTWDGTESRRGSDHSEVLNAEKAQLEADNAEVLDKIRQLDEWIADL